MKKFESVKGKVLRNLLIGSHLFTTSIVTLSYYVEQDKSPNEPYYVFAILTFVTLVFVSIWKRTFYTIKGNTLKSVSSIFYNNTDINNIKEIKQEFPLAGWKFVLSWKKEDSIRIIRNKEILPLYISPENQKEFIEELLKINPDIKISI